MQALIRREVGLLLPRQRQIFEMSRERGMSHGEICAELGLAKPSVKNSLVKALSFLRTFIQRHSDSLKILILIIWLVDNQGFFELDPTLRTSLKLCFNSFLTFTSFRHPSKEGSLNNIFFFRAKFNFDTRLCIKNNFRWKAGTIASGQPSQPVISILLYKSASGCQPDI
jgi:hypothetical protein